METSILIFTIFLSSINSVYSFKNKLNYDKKFCELEYLYQYPEYILNKECTDPLIYDRNSIHLHTRHSCMPVRKLKEVMKKEIMEVATTGGYDMKMAVTFIWVLQGLNQLDTEKVTGRKIALTSPRAILKIIDYSKVEWFSEFGIDIDAFEKDDNFIVRTVKGTRYVTLFPIANPYLHRQGINFHSTSGTVFVYYDTKNKIWPELHFVDRNKPESRYWHSVHVVVPGHLLYPNYNRLLNIRNTTAPWRPDDIHRDKRSLWCRGWRHLMALSEPVVRGKDGTIVLEPSGPRYCVVSTTALAHTSRQIAIEIFFHYHNDTQDSYGVTVLLYLENDGIFRAQSIVSRILWYKADMFHHKQLSSLNAKSDGKISRIVPTDSTMYNEHKLVLAAWKGQTIEIPRIALEFDQEGVPDMFSQRYRTLEEVRDETPSPFPPSVEEIDAPSTPVTSSVETTKNISSKIYDCVKAHVDALLVKLKKLAKPCDCDSSQDSSSSCDCGTASQSCACEPTSQQVVSSEESGSTSEIAQVKSVSTSSSCACGTASQSCACESTSQQLVSSEESGTTSEIVQVKSVSRDNVPLEWLNVASLLLYFYF